MTTRTRVLLGVVAAVVVGIVVLMGTGAYIVLKNLSITHPAADSVAVQFDELRRRFPERAPLIELDDPRRLRIRVNRPPRSAPLTHVEGFEVLMWQADEGKLVRTRAPLWMMRMSTMNLLTELGLAPGSLQLSVDDVERYGPGVVVDFTTPKGDRALIVAR